MVPQDAPRRNCISLARRQRRGCLAGNGAGAACQSPSSQLGHIVIHRARGNREIECQIRSVQQSLENDGSEPVSYDESAALWYREIYSPTVREIRESGAIERFPGRTVADLFIWMWRRTPELQIYCAQTSNSENENAPFNSLRRSFRKLSASVRRIFL